MTNANEIQMWLTSCDSCSLCSRGSANALQIFNTVWICNSLFGNVVQRKERWIVTYQLEFKSYAWFSYSFLFLPVFLNTKLWLYFISHVLEISRMLWLLCIVQERLRNVFRVVSCTNHAVSAFRTYDFNCQ